MRFTFRASTFVSGVAVRFVTDLKAARTEALGQFIADPVGNAHDSAVIKVTAFSSDVPFFPSANIGQKAAEILDDMVDVVGL